ncbi:MAG TPA: HipA domain-containing protein [Spirochaetia bacterium]|nr:HipA domain-containing protein [Spirochaetia bacterium]
MARRCPITYDEIPDGARYSPRGLRALSPRLSQLADLPYTQAEQLEAAARTAAKLSIQGVQPKLSARLDVSGGRLELVERGGTYIIKPQNDRFPELPENEDVTMRLAASAGLEVPFHGLVYAKDGSFSYVIRRFDRIGRAQKVAVEDFAQLAGLSRDTKYASTMERVADLVNRFTSFPAVERVKFFALTLFSFLVGNEDLHLKNFSIMTQDSVSSLSPAYDLLSTTIALPNAAEELALPLRGKKRGITRGDLVAYFAQERLGLNDATVEGVLERFRAAIDRWRTLIRRSFLSESRKEAYLQLLDERLTRIAL